MKKLFAAVCLMMCIFSCNRHAEPLRVMSYNIRLGVAKDSSNRWDIRKPATPAMLDAIRPAVFGVQEAYDFQVDYILKNCPRFKAVGVGREDGVHEGEHMSVFYDTTRINLLDWGNYWLSEHPESPGLGWDAACPRTATWTLLKDLASGKEFYFVNTHLDHVGKVAQREGLALIYNKIQEMNPSGRPMILTGDFNVLPDDESLSGINSLLLSARFSAPVADTIGSYNGYSKDNSVYKPIDYIYYNGFTCERFCIDTTTYLSIPFISDHYPVYADLRW